MHAPHAARCVRPLSAAHTRLVHLERRVRVAEHDLQHIPQAVLDVVRVPRAVRHEAHAEDVQTVQLVHHRHEKGGRLVGGGGIWGDGDGEVGESVGGGEERRPVVVGVEGEPGLAGLERYLDRGEVDGELVGKAWGLGVVRYVTNGVRAGDVRGS